MKKALAIVSLSLQGAYTFVCLLQITLCLIYENLVNFSVNNPLFSIMLLLVLPTTSVLIVLPICLACNITKTVFSFKEKSSRRVLWLVWSLLSPVIFIACFWPAAGLFVTVTGGA